MGSTRLGVKRKIVTSNFPNEISSPRVGDTRIVLVYFSKLFRSTIRVYGRNLSLRDSNLEFEGPIRLPSGFNF